MSVVSWRTPPAETVGAMSRLTAQDRAICALYCYGPCGPGTLAAVLGEDDADAVMNAIRPLLGTKVLTRTVTLAGVGAVELIYLRGNAP
jgi:hypothetical protein